MGTENEIEPTDTAPVIDENTVEVPPSKKKRSLADKWLNEADAQKGEKVDAHLERKRYDADEANKKALERQKENMKLRAVTKEEPKDVGKNDFKVPKADIKKASPEKRPFLETDSTPEEKEAQVKNQERKKAAREAYEKGEMPGGATYPKDETESEKRRKAEAKQKEAKQNEEKAQKAEIDKKKVPPTTKPNDIKAPLKTAAELAAEADKESAKKRAGASTGVVLTAAELAEIKAEIASVEQIETRIKGITSPTSRERGDLISTTDGLKKKREDLQKKYADKSGDKAYQSLITKIKEVESLADKKLNGRVSPTKTSPEKRKESYDEKQEREEAAKKLVTDAKSPIIEVTAPQAYGKYLGVHATPTGELKKYAGKAGEVYYVNKYGELVDYQGNNILETVAQRQTREKAQEAQVDVKATKGKDSDSTAKVDAPDARIDETPVKDAVPKFGTFKDSTVIKGATIFIYYKGTLDANGKPEVYYVNMLGERTDEMGVPLTEGADAKAERIKAEAKAKTDEKGGFINKAGGFFNKHLGKIANRTAGAVSAETEEMKRKNRNLTNTVGGSSSGGNELSDVGKKRLSKLKDRLEKCKNGYPESGDTTASVQKKIDDLLSGKYREIDPTCYVSASSKSGYTVDSNGRVVKANSVFGVGGGSKGGPASSTKDFSALTAKYGTKDAAGTIMGHAKGKDIGGTIMGHAGGKDAGGTIMGTGGGKDAAGTIMGQGGRNAAGTIMGQGGRNAAGTIMGTGGGRDATGTIMGADGTIIEGVNRRKNAEGTILGKNGKNPEGTIMGANAKNAEGSVIGGITKKNAANSIMGVVKNNLLITTEEPMLDEYGEPIVEYNEDGTVKAPVFAEKKQMVVAKQGNVLGIVPNGKAGHTSRIVRPGIKQKGKMVGGQKEGNSIGVDATGKAGHPSGIMRGTLKAKEDGSVAVAGARPSKMAHVAATIGGKGNTVGINSGHPSGIMRGTVKKEGNAVGESHPSKIMRGTVASKKSTGMMDYAVADAGSHPSKIMRGAQTSKLGLAQGDKIGLAQGDKIGLAQTDKIGLAQTDKIGLAQTNKIGLAKSEKGGHPSGILRTGAPKRKAGNPVATSEKGGHPSSILRTQVKEKSGHPSRILMKATRIDSTGHPSQMMRQGFSQPVALTASLAEPSSFQNKTAPIALIANSAPMFTQPKIQKDIMIPAVKTGPIVPHKSNSSMISGLDTHKGFSIPGARHTSIPNPPPSLIAPSVSYNTVVTPSPNADPRTGMIPDSIKHDKIKIGLSFGATSDVKKESLLSSKLG